MFWSFCQINENRWLFSFWTIVLHPTHTRPLIHLSSSTTSIRNTEKDFGAEKDREDKCKKNLLKNKCLPLSETLSSQEIYRDKVLFSMWSPIHHFYFLVWSIQNRYANKQTQKDHFFSKGLCSSATGESLGEKKILAGQGRLLCVLLSWAFCLPEVNSLLSHNSNMMQAITSHVELPSNHWCLVN